MSLSKDAEKKISNIKWETKLCGFYQFNNKEDAISVINRYQGDCLNDDGSFYKNNFEANCDPRYQELSAAIDYLKFDIKRAVYNFKNHKKMEVNNNINNNNINNDNN